MRTEAKPLRSVEALPFSSTHGEIEDAAVTIKVEPRGWARSSCRKRSKLAVSLGLTTLQPTPSLLGYSQLNKNVRETLHRMNVEHVLNIDTIEAVCRHHVDHSVDENRAIGGVPDVGRKV